MQLHSYVESLVATVQTPTQSTMQSKPAGGEGQALVGMRHRKKESWKAPAFVAGFDTATDYDLAFQLLALVHMIKNKNLDTDLASGRSYLSSTLQKEAHLSLIPPVAISIHINMSVATDQESSRCW